MPAPPPLPSPRTQQLHLPFAEMTRVPSTVQDALPTAVAASVRPRTIWRTLSEAQRGQVRWALLTLAATLLREERADAELSS
jgi:hypothetical protein